VAALHRATRRPWEARLRRPWGAQRRRPWGARPRRMEEPVHGRARRQTEQRPLAHHYERFLVCVSSTRDLFLPLVVMGTQNGCSVCVCCWRPVWIGKTIVRDAKCIWVTVWVCCWRQPNGNPRPSPGETQILCSRGQRLPYAQSRTSVRPPIIQRQTPRWLACGNLLPARRWLWLVRGLFRQLAATNRVLAVEFDTVQTASAGALP
jgi:hypothetical protein